MVNLRFNASRRIITQKSSKEAFCVMVEEEGFDSQRFNAARPAGGFAVPFCLSAKW
jgi:hypothetical protein